MKKMKLILFALMLASALRAQYTTCATSQTLSFPVSNYSTTGTSSTKELWFSLTLNSGNYNVSLANLDVPARVKELRIYGGSCAGLNFFNRDSLETPNDSLLSVNFTNTVTSNQIYLRLITTTTNTVKFYLNATSRSLNWGCPGGTPPCTVNASCELVCNGDFEYIIGTPSVTAQFSLAYGWDVAGSGTPDLFSSNAPLATWVSIPCNIVGNESLTTTPCATQNQYAGIEFMDPPNFWQAEYIETQLSSAMVAGKSYVISFLINKATNRSATINGLGIFLTSTAIIGQPTVTPTRSITNTSLLNNTSAWTKLTFCYTASGGENYLTIGQPAGSAFTVTPGASVPSPTCGVGNTNTNQGYLYIDEVSVKYIDINAGSTQTVTPCNTVALNTNFSCGVPDIAPITYSWTGGPGTITSPSLSNTTAQVNSNAVFSINVSGSGTDGVGCTATASFSVISTLSVSPGNSNTICLNSSLTLTASGASGYTWQPGNLTGSLVTLSPTVSTTYTLTGSGTGCTSTQTIDIIVNPLPSDFTITAASTTSCFSQTNTLSITGPVSGTVTWQPGALTGSTVVHTQTATVTYSATMTNSLGCSLTKTLAVNFSNGAPAAFTVTSTSNPVCMTGTVAGNATLTATGNGVSYTWQPGAATGASVAISPTATTIYTVTASTSVGCTGTQTLLIAVSNSCCTQTITPFNGSAFSPTTTFATPLVFNGDVTVTAGNSAWLSKSYFLFAPGVKVIVEPGATFNVEGSHLYACSGTMWKGVVVQDGGAVHTYSTLGTASVVLHSLIEDAETAIDASSQSTSSLTSSYGIIECKNTTFNKNNIDIKFDGYQQTNSSYPFSLHECVFTCRTLTYSATDWPRTTTTELRGTGVGTPTTGLASPYDLMGFSTTTLLAPYSGSISNTALYLNNIGTTSGGTCYAVNVGSTSAVDEFNLFDGHVYGIKAINSNVESFNNVFQNGNTSNSYPAGVAITHSVGTSSNMWLNLYSGSTDPSLGNRFWNWPTSVALANTYTFNCQYATFRSTQSTVSPSPYSAGNYGIFSAGNRFNYEISNNNFNNINTGYRMMVLPGVYATGGGTAYGVYSNNVSIQNNFFGAQLTGTTSITNQYMNQAIAISAAINYTWNNVANTGLYINSNTIDRAYRGINVTGLRNYPGAIVNNTIKLADDNLYNAPQKGIYIANNMLTLGVATNTLQANGTTNTQVCLISSGLGANHHVTCNDLRNAYRGFEFISQQPGAVWKGNTMQPMPIGYALITGGVIGTQGATTSPIDNQWNSTWTGYYQTYVDMTSDAQFSKIWVQSGGVYQPTLNTGNITTYYGATGNINLTTGSYSCGGGGAPPNIIVPNTSSLSNGMGHIANDVLYRYLEINPDSIAGSVLTSFVNSFSLTSHDYFMQVEGALYNNDPSTASSLLSSVSSTNVVETNTQNFYQLFIDYLNNSFGATDSATLHDMKDYCPGTYGSWVYQARSLYDQIYGLTSPPEPDCLDFPSAGRLFHNPTNNNPGITPITTDVVLSPNQGSQTIKQADNWKVGIYPNPAKNDLSIGSSLDNETVQVRIEDSQGRLLSVDLVEIKNHAAVLHLDLQNGIYFVTLTNSQKQSVTQKLVISK